MVGPHSLPLSLSSLWSEFRSEIDAYAVELADEGWSTETFTIGEVRPITSDASPVDIPGLRALIPDNHFEHFSDLINQNHDYTCEIFKRSIRDDAVFILLVYRFGQLDKAILIPLFYRLDDADEMLAEARSIGKFITLFRPLDRRSTVTIEHEDSSLFLPDG